MSKDFDQFYREYQERIYRLCLGFCGDPEQAMDLCQEVFIKVWQNLPQFKGQSSIGTWAYRIAVNTCLRDLEKGKRMQQVPLSDLIDGRTGPAEKEQEISLLYRAIASLDEADRLLIGLVLEDLPYADMSAILNISEGNLRVRIHRVKQKLSEKLKRHGQF
jgi:RNA polymerase sigma-70 factor (ECF subfamily)